MSSCPHCGVELDEKPKGKPRSVPQHRRFYALVKAAHSHWPSDHRFQPTSAEHMRKYLQAKAGYHNIQTIDTAGMEATQAIIAVAAALKAADPINFPAVVGSKFHVVSSKSIDFDSLPHLAACALFDAVADTIRAETGLDADAIMPPVRQQTSVKRELLAEVPI